MRWIPLALALTSCRSEETIGSIECPRHNALESCSPREGPSLFPMAVGAWWIFEVEDAGSSTPLPDKVMRIVAEEEDGTFVFELPPSGDDPNGLRRVADTGCRIEWRDKTGWTIDGTREVASVQTYDPDRLRLDYSAARSKASAHWTECYDETTVECDLDPQTSLEDCPAEHRTTETEAVAERWRVRESAEVVEVPAGTYEAFCVERETDPTSAHSQGRFCFAPGVGKVLEETEQIERLKACCIPGPDDACSVEDVDGVCPPPVCDESPGLLYPLVVGAWWRHPTLHSEGNYDCPDKVVSVEAQTELPLEPGTTALRVRSERAGTWGYRWQSLLADGSVVRNLDEWFDDETGTRTQIDYYCPDRIRVDDGAHACLGAAWTEHVTSLRIRPSVPGTWPACETVAVDPDSCAVDGAIPDGCVVDADETDTFWEVLALDEVVESEAGTFSTLHLRQTGADDVEEYWWARGVGKIRNHEATQDELLSEYCIPPTCTDPPPSYEERLADCR